VDESRDIFVTRYKLGFGGQVTALPGGYEYIPSGPIRWAYRRIYPAIRKWGAIRTVRRALRHGLHARNQRAA
jgi:lipid II:glycine glycyltransferase (peptidoglycan interpeptide bridge formation enzyme)